MPRVSVSRRFVKLICAACVLPALARAQDDSVPTMDEIIAVCRQRQEAVTSGRFKWTVDRWMKKGSVGHAADIQATAPPNPPEDLQITLERMLLFSGEKLRYESFGPAWNPAKDAYTSFRLTTTWDGAKSRVFEDPDGFWNGTVSNSEWFQYLHTFDPLAWTYRLFDKNWTAFDINDFRVSTIEQVAGDEPCVLLEHSRASRATPQQPIVQRLWLSRNRHYVVRRYELARGVTVSKRIDIEYGDSSQGFPVPTSWTRLDGASTVPPSSSYRCTVSDHELNIPVEAQEFTLTFPADTWVQEAGVDDPYIVREDGSHRPITKAELLRGATYDDLLVTSSGQARSIPLQRASYVWCFWTLQGVLASGIVWYLYVTRWNKA